MTRYFSGSKYFGQFYALIEERALGKILGYRLQHLATGCYTKKVFTRKADAVGRYRALEKRPVKPSDRFWFLPGVLR